MPEQTALRTAMTQAGGNLCRLVDIWLRTHAEALEHTDAMPAAVILLALRDAIADPDRDGYPRLVQAVDLNINRVVSVMGDTAVDVAMSLIRSGADDGDPAWPVLRELAFLVMTTAQAITDAHAAMAADLEKL